MRDKEPIRLVSRILRRSSDVVSSTGEAINAVITMLVALESQFEQQSPGQIKYLELGLSFLPHYAHLFAVAAAPVWN
jgi:hypothetical protein